MLATTTRARVAAVMATSVLSLGAAGVAHAQTQQEGLVNVNADN
jgi:hypothetical protein